MLKGKKIFCYSKDCQAPVFLKKALQVPGSVYKQFHHQKMLWHNIIEESPDVVIFNLTNKSRAQLKELDLLVNVLSEIKIPVLVVTYFNHQNFLKSIESIRIPYMLTGEYAQRNLYAKLKKIFLDSEKEGQSFSFRPNNVKTKVTIEGKLTRLGESSCQVLAPINYDRGQGNVKINSPYLESEGVTFSKVTKLGSSHYLNKSGHLTNFILKGVTERTAQKIRAQRNKWGWYS